VIIQNNSPRKTTPKVCKKLQKKCQEMSVFKNHNMVENGGLKQAKQAN
jgi:hypothetical protein